MSEGRTLRNNDNENGELSNREKQEVLLSCPTTGTTARASSVLQRNAKTYGPKNALVGTNNTCWNSDAGEESVHYVVDFGRQVLISRLKIEFQAGFAAETCLVSTQRNNDSSKQKFDQIGEWETLDQHGMQTYEEMKQKNVTTSVLKLTFEDCTDFYGRVVLYHVQVWGYETDSS